MRLEWDQIGEKLYETGVSNGVLYPAVNGAYPKGVAWNGLTGVTESPSGAEASPLYANNGTYLNLLSAEKFAATVTAYTYPDEFAELNGEKEIAKGVSVGQQKRGVFGLCYRTILGNDTDNEEYGYKLHIVYGGQAAPSEKAYNSVNESPEAINMSWAVSTTPVTVSGKKPTASLTITSTNVDPDRLALLEGILYGTESADARLPLPDEIATIIGTVNIQPMALSTSVPTSNATSIAVGSNVVLTFNNQLLRESVSVMEATTGAVVPCTKTIDSTGKIVTIKPATSLKAATKYVIVIAGVVDIYNQTLAATSNTFTTA